MSGPNPDTDRLLYRIRVVASVVALGLFALVVIDERDAATVGMIFGALSVLLGLVSADYLRR